MPGKQKPKNLASIVRVVVASDSKQHKSGGLPSKRPDLSSQAKLIENQLPLLEGDMRKQQELLMQAMVAIAMSEQPDPDFMASPSKYLQERNVFLFEKDEIAPGVLFSEDGFKELMLRTRDFVRNVNVATESVFAVHTSTSTSSYVREGTRTSFTSNTTTGTEKSAIVSSETRTMTVTSGRDLLGIELRNVLFDPYILTPRSGDQE